MGEDCIVPLAPAGQARLSCISSLDACTFQAVLLVCEYLLLCIAVVAHSAVDCCGVAKLTTLFACLACRKHVWACLAGHTPDDLNAVHCLWIWKNNQTREGVWRCLLHCLPLIVAVIEMCRSRCVCMVGVCGAQSRKRCKQDL